MVHKHFGRVQRAAGFILAASGVPQAMALPPGGAATSNTPGTSSSVSPTELKACETIHWQVTGFAPNEQVNVKVDEGAASGGDASVQGQGVLSTAMADGSGTASNSFEVPCDLEVGPHSLRFLATEIINEDKGETKGYTNRSQDFYIVGDGDSAADSGADSGSGGSDSGGSGASGSASGGGNAGGGAVIGGGSDDEGGQVTRRTVVRQNGAGGTNDSGRGSGGSAGSRSAGAQAGNSAKSAKNKSNGSKPKSSNDILKASGGSAEGDDATYADDGTVLAASQSGNGAPVVGLSVGGAILIVGLAAVAAYLYVNGGRREAAGPTASDDTQQIKRVQH